MKHLPSITLCCIDTRHPKLAFEALLKSTEQCHFKEVLFFTNNEFVVPEYHIENLRVIRNDSISTIDAYSHFVIKQLHSFITTSHCMIIQWDGFVIHPESWSDAFLDYDYIGALWRKKNGYVVGNGGFSLRSKKLLEALASNDIIPHHPEDDCICDTNKKLLQSRWNIRFAPVHIAERFSFEFTAYTGRQFGFHGMSNFPLVLDEKELDRFIDLMPPSLFVNEYFIGFSRRIGAAPDRKAYRRLSAKLESYLQSNIPGSLTSKQADILVESLLNLRQYASATGLLLNQDLKPKWKVKYLKLVLGRYSAKS